MDKEQIIVSVIVLTYNHKNYIRQALDSILMQEVGFRYEILIGDDASTDGTSAIVQEYAENYPDVIRAFIRKKNIGATNNLYDLFQRTRGKYIASCEGDDFWIDPRKLQIQVDWLSDNTEYIGCYHSCMVVDESNRNVQKPKWIKEKLRFEFKDFGGIILPGHPSSWVYRNVFLNPLHDYSIICQAHPVIADRTVILILLAQGDFGFIDRKMSCYRCIQKSGGSNATSRLFVKQDNSKFVEYQLTINLERYAKEELNRDTDFSAFLHLLLFKAIVKMVIKPCKARRCCVKDILKAATTRKRLMRRRRL